MKRTILPALLLLLVVPAAVPRVQAADGRPLVAVLGAFPMEIAALHTEFGIDAPGSGFTHTTLGGVRFDRGDVDGHDVLVFQAGPSLVNAAFKLQLALDHFPVTQVLFGGIAGGIDPSRQVGDVVIPERWAYHSEAAYLNEDGHGDYVRPSYYAKADSEHFGMIFPQSVYGVREGDNPYAPIPFFPADPGMLEAARRAVPKLPAMMRSGHAVTTTVGGVGVSGTVLLDNAEYREWVFKVWQARCVDMESAALAQVCFANGKPLLVVRGLSDLAGGQKGKELTDMKALMEVLGVTAKVAHGVLDELPK